MRRYSITALRLIASICLVQFGMATARADELDSLSSAEPLSDSLVTESGWDEPALGASVVHLTPNEAALTQRVEALERTLRNMESLKVDLAAGEEQLPEKPKKKEDTELGLPKKIDIISKPTFTPTGRIYFDGVTYNDDEATKAFFNTDRENELGFRTFRIGGKGNIYENLIYSMEVELRGGPNAVSFKDIYMEQQSIPGIGHFRAGHFKEPIGLEEFGSDLFNTFMEKSPATQAFAPSRNFGVMAWDTVDACQDATWFLGAFRAESPDAPQTNTGLWRSDSDDWAFDYRYAWLPYYDEPSGGRYLVHLGLSYSFRQMGQTNTAGASLNQNVAASLPLDGAQFTTRSWVGSQGPIGVGAEADSNEWNQINGEFLTIWGPLSLQSEYFQVLMNSGEQYNGGYAMASYFLTGESRAYRKDTKVIDRTTPFEPFFWIDTCKGAACGRGAWEIAAGYSWVDLRDGHDTVATTPATSANRRRAFVNEFVIGLNWYQNPWSRVYFDYEHEIADFVTAGTPTGDADIFGVRWQVDW